METPPSLVMPKQGKYYLARLMETSIVGGADQERPRHFFIASSHFYRTSDLIHFGGSFLMELNRYFDSSFLLPEYIDDTFTDFFQRAERKSKSMGADYFSLDHFTPDVMACDDGSAFNQLTGNPSGYSISMRAQLQCYCRIDRQLSFKDFD